MDDLGPLTRCPNILLSRARELERNRGREPHPPQHSTLARHSPRPAVRILLTRGQAGLREKGDGFCRLGKEGSDGDRDEWPLAGLGTDVP